MDLLFGIGKTPRPPDEKDHEEDEGNGPGPVAEQQKDGAQDPQDQEDLKSAVHVRKETAFLEEPQEIPRNGNSGVDEKQPSPEEEPHFEPQPPPPGVRISITSPSSTSSTTLPGRMRFLPARQRTFCPRFPA